MTTQLVQRAVGRTPSLLDLLYQDERWIDRDRIVYRVEDMTPIHRERLLRWLHRHAEGLELTDALVWLDGDLAPGSDSMAGEEFTDALATRDPDEWLRSLPLVRKLWALGATA